MSLACSDAFMPQSPTCCDTQQHQVDDATNWKSNGGNSSSNSPNHQHGLETLQRALFSVHGLQCPLSARCTLEEHECVLEHVKRVHRVPECDVEVDPRGMGVVEMEIDVPSRLQKRTQYSAMLLKFEGLFFLWTLESRLRADAETQVSAVVQIITPADATPRSRASTLPGASSPSSPNTLAMDLSALLLEMGDNGGNSTPPPPSTPPSPQSFRVAVSIDAPGSCASQPPHEHVVPMVLPSPAHRGSVGSPPGKGFFGEDLDRMPSVSSPSSPPASSLPWFPNWSTTLVFDGCCTPRRHERLISHGKGLVALWPTHAHLFSTSSSKPDMLQFAVRTIIERA